MIGTIYRIEAPHVTIEGRIQGTGGFLGGAGPKRTPKQAKAGLERLRAFAAEGNRHVIVFPRFTFEGNGVAHEVALTPEYVISIVDFDTDEPITLETDRETARLAWKFLPRIKVSELKRGDAFFSSEGDAWHYVRKDGALSGAHHAEYRGCESTFAGNAEVLKLKGSP